MLSQMAGFHCFLWLSNIPLCIYTTSSLSTLPLMGPWVAKRFLKPFAILTPSQHLLPEEHNLQQQETYTSTKSAGKRRNSEKTMKQCISYNKNDVNCQLGDCKSYY